MAQTKDNRMQGLEEQMAGVTLGSRRRISPRTFYRLFGSPKYKEEMKTPTTSKIYKDDDWSPSVVQTPLTSFADSEATPVSVNIDQKDAIRCRRLHQVFESRKNEAPQIIIRQGGHALSTPKLNYIKSYAEASNTATTLSSAWTPLDKENFSPATTTKSLEIGDDYYYEDEDNSPLLK
uniref:Uncharacterized protein n=1 Tax=Aureoumbra lagunensis TaxID=44058 RepID=A0A7S3K2W8_9STRA